MRFRIAVCAAAIVGAGSVALMAQTQAQPPRFKATVEVVPIDVTVVDDRGQPIRDLTPADFSVRIDGAVRRVLSAEWVSLVTDAKSTPAVVPEGYSSNENATGGRLIVLAVDEPNIRFGGARGLTNAADAFVDHLQPSDRIAAVGLGVGSAATAFTSDRARVKEAIARMVGQKRIGLGILQFNISTTEAVAIANGDRTSEEVVVARECRNERTAQALDACRQGVLSEALQIGQDVRQGADQTIRMLRNLLVGLEGIDAPKTLILMSEGFVIDGTSGEVTELGALAARARTSLYTLLLDDQVFDVSNSRAPIAPIADRRARTEGLETLAGAARGTVFTIAGTGSSVFDRIESEIMGYYLLGIEPDAKDSDGKAHPVRVDVPRRGAIVRARRQLAPPAAAARHDSPRAAVTAALSSPLPMSALPLRVAAFSLQGPEASKVQVLIHADVGTDFTAPKRMTVGYTIVARDGRLVDSQMAESRLAPAMNGVPSSLQYVAGASLVPGDYTLKIVVADEDRVGSVEHPIHAGLVDAGSTRLSELMVGGPVSADVPLRPTIGYSVNYGTVHGYLEAYGADAASLTVKYDVATDDTSPPILSEDVPGRSAGNGRVLFSRVMIVRALPAGRYRLRATVSAGGRAVKTMTRAFEVAAPPVLMTSATGLGDAPSTDGELFLPVEEGTIASPFRREDAVKEATLEPFRSRVPQGVRSAFDKGVLQLSSGDYIRAETSFKAAIQPDGDSTAALAYLAACFAASGHDAEAASAWQTALVDGGDMPQIYNWLGDALLRTHSLAEARSVLEEAAQRWPADVRFTRPLALVYAMLGRGREAVRTLERVLSAGASDTGLLALGVEWIYQVHAAGGLVHNRAEDLKLAHRYADEYAKASGPKGELVKQWMDYLDREPRK